MKNYKKYVSIGLISFRAGAMAQEPMQDIIPCPLASQDLRTSQKDEGTFFQAGNLWERQSSAEMRGYKQQILILKNNPPQTGVFLNFLSLGKIAPSFFFPNSREKAENSGLDGGNPALPLENPERIENDQILSSQDLKLLKNNRDFFRFSFYAFCGLTVLSTNLLRGSLNQDDFVSKLFLRAALGNMLLLGYKFVVSDRKIRAREGSINQSQKKKSGGLLYSRGWNRPPSTSFNSWF